MDFSRINPGKTPGIGGLQRWFAPRTKVLSQSIACAGLDPLARIAAGLAITYGGAAWDFE